QKSKLQFKTQKLRIESTDINSLLVDFLSEILAKSQINKKVYKADFVKIRPESAEGLHYLEAELIGFPIERFDEDIKAVTYQDVNIKLKTKNLKLKTKVWQTDLVFDI
ncbi:MAG: archease, partial [Patescibacteria group bacterium]